MFTVYGELMLTLHILLSVYHKADNIHCDEHVLFGTERSRIQGAFSPKNTESLGGEYFREKLSGRI